MWQSYTNRSQPSAASASNSHLESPFLRTPTVLALLVGALLGGLSGYLVGDIRNTPLGGLAGALLGVLAGLAFVVVGLCLYRFVRDAWSGALVLGLFAMLAMLLVGGVFGALIGLLTGVVLGALAGAVKARGGLVIGDMAPAPRDRVTPARGRTPSLLQRRSMSHGDTARDTSLPTGSRKAM